MPKKIRELKSMLRKAGFYFRSGKGAHTIWFHPIHKDAHVTLCGNDGADAKLYLEKKVKASIKKVEGNK
jgi:predicted RNA binding protein YcfA (HicA-like mRNA interferase family)